MILKEHIGAIRDGLQTEQYKNKAEISQGIVLRLLDALNWPMYDTQIIIPEYVVEGRGGGYALCHPALEPCFLIKIKDLTYTPDAERQLFRHAYRSDIPVVIFTDGRRWQFFHPSEGEEYGDYKVCELDLIKGDSAQNTERFKRYLSYNSVRTGEAFSAIEKDHKNIYRQREVEKRLPEAWEKLIEQEDEFLLKVVAKKVGALCGYIPTNEQILDFLRGLKRKAEEIPETRLRQSNSEPQRGGIGYRGSRQKKSSITRLRVTMPDGTKIEETYASVTFGKTIEWIGVEKVRSLNIRDIIPLVSTSKDSFYHQYQAGRYYIMTGISNKRKKYLLEEIAMRLKVRLKVEIIDRSTGTVL